jgi:phosphoglycerol transferase MdoB-like AlkP superfamily enzyme
MLTRLRFLVLYFLFWIGCFEGGRVLFLLYQWRSTVRLDFFLIAGIFLHGLQMDISLVCAVMIIPLCIIARAEFLPPRDTKRLIIGYTAAVLAISTLGIVADLEVFSVWGYRLDSSPLQYLTSSREAFASAAGSPLAFLALLLIAAFGLAITVFSKALLPHLDGIPRQGQLKSVLLVALLAPGITIGARGGINRRMHITPGSVYFSRDNFANQAAINPVWNFFASVITGSGTLTVEKVADRSVAQAIVDSLLAEPSGSDAATPKLLRMRPRNIILIFWESLTGKIVEREQGLHGITPGFNQLAQEGILFDRMYASGNRTTNGLVAVLSGLPSHPTANPLESPELVAALPRISVSMVNQGYRAGFFYGGPLSFDNRNRFLLRGRYDVIVERKDFDPSEWQSPWGVHDPVMLDRLFHSVDTASVPMFAVSFTLSSHEPFTVPGRVFVKGDNTESRFLNAQAYSDSAVYEFIQRAEKSSWWDSTLVVIVADHGSPYPYLGSPLASASGQYRIPMLWLGGALAVRDTVIHRIGSQADIPKVLFNQLGISSTQFHWSKDFLNPSSHPWAFYAFRNGFGFVDNSGAYVFDNVAKRVIQRFGAPTPASVRAGRAFQQMVMQSYVDLSAPRMATNAAR